MIRSISVLTCAAVLAAGLAMPAERAVKRYKGNWDIQNKSDSSANDFHISITLAGTTVYQPGNFYTTPFFNQPPTESSSGGGGDIHVDLNWVHTGPGPLMNPGDPAVHVG